MPTTDESLTTTERRHLAALSQTLRNSNTPLAMDAQECLEIFERRKNERKERTAKTIDDLQAVYRVFIRAECNTKSAGTLMEALLQEGTLKTSAKRLNAIVKATITNDRRYASKLSNVIRLALHENVEINNLRGFVAKHGGIGKSSEKYTDLTAARGSSKAPARRSIAVKISDPKVIKVFAKFQDRAMARKKKKTVKAELRFFADGKATIVTIGPAPTNSKGGHW